MAQLLIKNGRVIDPAAGRDAVADVLIDDGRVAKVSADIAAPGVELLDARGCIVAPGFIDMHVHLREPGIEHAETIETGSRAAAAGGFTSIRCMPKTVPGNDNATRTSHTLDRGRKAPPTQVVPSRAVTQGSAGGELA